MSVAVADARRSGRVSRSPSAAREPAQAPEPSQPSLRRIRRFGVRPDHELGQNFLIDSNILGVIDRAAELSAQDVVLEIGGGVGVLSEHLAERVEHVHVVELDEHLREALCDATDPHANVSVHWGDAMRLDLAAFRPLPTKLVANLPYNIAAGSILRTIGVYPAMTRWVAMVQREVGERFAAQPGTSAYGAPSVLAQLSCEVRVLRVIARSVFYPVPNVDSVLLLLVRHEGDDATHELRELVRHAFAHRRKTLAGSLALAGRGGGTTGEEGWAAGRASGLVGGRSREEIRLALSRLGLPENVRAERVSPEQFRELEGLLDE